MSGFFSKTHESIPEPITDQNDYRYCTGSIDNVSFSGLMTFERCPYALFLDKVSKIPGVSGPAATRGSSIHDMLKQYVNGTLDETEINWNLMKSGSYHKNLIDTFRKDYEQGLVIPEFKYAINKKLKPTKWDSQTMWHRGAIDLVLFKTLKKKQAVMFDYKTGKMNKTVVHRSQLLLYALMLFIHFPKLEDITSSPLYLDFKVDPFYTTFKRSDLDLFLPRWVTRFKQVTEATVFPARPNKFNCMWCQHKTPQAELNQVEPSCSFGVM